MTQVTQEIIAAAIEAAQRVAAKTPMPATNDLVVHPPGAAALPSGHVRTLDDAIDSAGADIGQFVSLETGGFRIGKATVVIPQIAGTVDLSAIRFPYGVRFTVGGKTSYATSYDGVREARSGRDWASVVAQAQQLDPNCYGQYDKAEIVLTLVQDLVVGDKTLPANSTLGIGMPPSGYKPFMAWLKGVKTEFGSTGIVPVVASVEIKTKQGTKSWAIPVFTVAS